MPTGGQQEREQHLRLFDGPANGREIEAGGQVPQRQARVANDTANTIQSGTTVT